MKRYLTPEMNLVILATEDVMQLLLFRKATPPNCRPSASVISNSDLSDTLSLGAGCRTFCKGVFL